MKDGVMFAIALNIRIDPPEVRRVDRDIHTGEVSVVIELPAIIRLSLKGPRAKEQRDEGEGNCAEENPAACGKRSHGVFH